VTHPHGAAPAMHPHSAAPAAHARLRPGQAALLQAADYVTWATYGGAAAVVLLVLCGVIMAMRVGGDKAAEADAEQPADVVIDEAAAASAAEAAADSAEPTKQERVDFEKLLKLLAKRAAQKVGPKVAKVHSIRSVLMTHVLSFRKSMTNFIMDEFMSTVGVIFREVGAEEFMLMLNPAASSTAGLPPASILLAGLLSPVILTVSLIIHLSQVFFVFLPTLALCAWAIWMDRHTLDDCAVPTIRPWVYVQASTAFLLVVAHLAVTAQIQSSKNSINAKIEGMKERLRQAVSDQELSVDEIRELLIIVSILLEHSLVEEDKLRRSAWRSVIGYGTMFWMVTVLWNFVLVLGWTFVPGMVAFHAAAAEVAGDDYCGAWATVFAARLTCVVSLLFMMFNMLSVVQFFSDKLVISEAYSSAVISQARKLDQTMLGTPVVETVVKAFLLRGTGDSLKAQIAMSRGETAALESERDDLVTRIDDLNRRIQLYQTEAEVLKREAGIVDEEPSAEAAAQTAMSSDMSRAKVLEEATKEEIDHLYAKMLAATANIRNQGLEALSSARGPRPDAAAGSGAAPAAQPADQKTTG